MDKEEILQLIEQRARIIAEDIVNKRMQNMPEQIPWVNTALLVPEVSILGYESNWAAIIQLQADMTSVEDRLSAGGL